MSSSKNSAATFLRRHGMAGALAGMGILHFAMPKPFDGLIPPELPGTRRTWTYGSGVTELGVAGLLANPRTRKLGGLSAVILFIGVFPGNIHMVRAWKRKPVWPWKVIAWARLPLQLPMITAAWSIYKAEKRRDERGRSE